MVLSNHQSWVDILVLQRIFHRKIPFLKFFLKKELIWVPIIGLAWWALDFPFMKRYSQAFLEKHPHLKGKDLETTKKACEKFKTIPVSVMNFAEGTRFMAAKHKLQQSPYKNLLLPKAGGMAFVFQAMGEQLHRIVDVTIAYPGGAKSFWQFLCGKVDEVKVRVRTYPLSGELLGDYFNDSEYRERFQKWLNELWAEKDRQIERMLRSKTVAVGA
jgi:1-acyl-sn-glycerol-3-phosphate acyltransferase